MKEVIKSNILILLFVSATIISACKDSITEPETTTPGNTDNNLANFSKIQQQVFTPVCAVSGCHSGSAPRANMDLSEGKAYANLVNITSARNSNFKRVEPGNSGNSFIIKMLKNTGENTVQMPPTGPLASRIIDSIAVWIDNGALNN